MNSDCTNDSILKGDPPDLKAASLMILDYGKRNGLTAGQLINVFEVGINALAASLERPAWLARIEATNADPVAA